MAASNTMMLLVQKIEDFFPNETDMPTLQDLKNPTSSMVYTFLTRVLFEFNIGIDSLRMAHYSQSLCSKYPESYSEFIPYINVYEIIRRIFQMADINVDFGMRDILQPQPNQNVKVMNACMDFLIYADQKMEYLKPMFDAIRQEKEKLANMEQQKQLLREKINEMMNRNSALDKKQRDLQKSKEKLCQIIKSKAEDRESLQKIKEAAVAKLKESEGRLGKATVKLQELQEERDKLRALIVDSPVKIKADIENQRRKRVEASKRLEELRDNITLIKAQNNHLVSVLETLEKWRKKMERAQELTKITGTLEAKLKEQTSHLDALEKSYKELEKKHVANVKKIEAAEMKEKDMCDEHEKRVGSLKSAMEEKRKCLESSVKSTEEATKAHAALLAELEEKTQVQNKACEVFNNMMKMLHDKCEEIIKQDAEFSSSYLNASQDRLAELTNIFQKNKLPASVKENKNDNAENKENSIELDSKLNTELV